MRAVDSRPHRLCPAARSFKRNATRSRRSVGIAAGWPAAL